MREEGLSVVVSTHMSPLFWYIFRPCSGTGAQDDGGFNVALYPNNTLTYCRFNSAEQVVDTSTFQLPPEILGQYMMIVQSQSWWLGRVPLHIGTGTQPLYSSMFGFAGHPLFACDEINTLVMEPFDSERGMFARRLRMVLESICEMLISCGVMLTVDSFEWDWRMISPVDPSMYTMQDPMQSTQPQQVQQTMPEYYNYNQAAM